MTKVQAIKKLMEDNEGLASLSLIYKYIEEYYPNAKKSQHWEAGLRGVLYREINNNKTFKRVDDALFALIDFEEEVYLIENDKIKLLPIENRELYLEYHRDIILKKVG